jgi:hypothetical protein
MPRTLPAALTTAMDSGSYIPYLKVHINSAPVEAGQETFDPLYFRLDALHAVVKVEYRDVDLLYFRIERGAVISGTPSTISSIWFKTYQYEYDGKFLTLMGEPLERIASSATPMAGTALTYEDAIDSFLDNGYSTVSYSYEGGTPAWRLYNFYPVDAPLILGQRKRLFTLFEQKMLCFATEDGWQDKGGGGGTKNYIHFFRPSDIITTDYEVTDPLCTYSSRQETRQLVWKDETGAQHTNGSAADPRHNLGYLEAAATQPYNGTVFQAGSHSSKLAVHLKRRTGDKVRIIINSGFALSAMRVIVTEIFDPKSNPSWYQVLSTLEWYRGTEGGSMPSAIEPATPFTQVYTGRFDGILSDADNNLQTALDTLDDHTHVNYFRLVWGTYTHPTNPQTVTNAEPYGATIDETVYFVRFRAGCYVGGTNDVNNYWDIKLIRWTDSATIATLSTTGLAGSTHLNLNTTTFSIASATTANIGVLIRCVKIGSPGSLYIIGPAVVVRT